MQPKAVVALELLKNDVQIFGPDQIKMIKGYLQDTGIRTNIVSLFETLRSELKRTSPPSDYQRYNELKGKFRAHIEQRIRLLLHPNEGHDPWMEQSASSSNDEKLLEMSRHIRDVLFTCELVAEYHLANGVTISLQELHDLISHLEQSYIPRVDRKIGQDVAASIIHSFKELEQDMQNGEFAKAKALLHSIQKKLSVESVAFKHIYSQNFAQELPVERSIKDATKKQWP